MLKKKSECVSAYLYVYVNRKSVEKIMKTYSHK